MEEWVERDLYKMAEKEGKTEIGMVVEREREFGLEGIRRHTTLA